jgi:hypothetical protein
MRLAMCCSSRFSLRNDFSNKLLEKSGRRRFRVGMKGRHTPNPAVAAATIQYRTDDAYRF